MGCGVVFEVPCLADTSIECSSDKHTIGQIVDLTLLTDQIHSFIAFQSKYLPNKVMGFTTHLTKAYSTSFWNNDLLTSHSSQPLPIFNFVNTNTQVQWFILQIEKLTVSNDSDGSLHHGD